MIYFLIKLRLVM